MGTKSRAAVVIDLKLKSGLLISDAGARLREKFSLWSWDRYDAYVPKNPNKVHVDDVDVVYRLGARTGRAVYSEMLNEKGSRLARCLKALPASRALEDVNLAKLHQPMVELFDLILTTPGIKLAGATKLLFPFRPKLLPVIDSVVDEYYWFATSLSDERRFRVLSESVSPGQYVFELLLLMADDIKQSRKQIDQILDSCRPADFASASRVRVLELLIWMYYARPPREG